jgi:hypothetical protein
VQDISTPTQLRKREFWRVPEVMCTNLLHSDLVTLQEAPASHRPVVKNFDW